VSTIDFPASPSVGQNYVFGDRTWQWNGEGWQRIINAGQIVTVFVAITAVNDLATLTSPVPSFVQISYV